MKFDQKHMARIIVTQSNSQKNITNLFKVRILKKYALKKEVCSFGREER